MQPTNFYEILRNSNDQLWNSIFNHAFVKGIGDGTLPEDKYSFFLKQDYLYLIDFSRVFALGAAKAHQLNDMGYFATLLNATLNMEMDLHRRTCERFGIAAKELEETEKSMITTAYTNFLIRSCYEGSFKDLLAVLLPCAAGYTEIGRLLKSRGLPENTFYRDWINTYASEEFQEFADWLIAKMNGLSEGSGEEDKNRWHQLYRFSARFEYLFFDMSWKMEMWPEAIPIEK